MTVRDDFRTSSTSIARWIQAEIEANRSYHATVGTSKEKNRIRIPTELGGAINWLSAIEESDKLDCVAIACSLGVLISPYSQQHEEQEELTLLGDLLRTVLLASREPMPQSPALADEWKAAQSLLALAQPVVIEHPKGANAGRRFVPPQLFRRLRWLPESGGVVVLRRFEPDKSVLQVITSERAFPTETAHDHLVFADASLDALKEWLGQADSEGD